MSKKPEAGHSDPTIKPGGPPGTSVLPEVHTTGRTSTAARKSQNDHPIHFVDKNQKWEDVLKKKEPTTEHVWNFSPSSNTSADDIITNQPKSSQSRLPPREKSPTSLENNPIQSSIPALTQQPHKRYVRSTSSIGSEGNPENSTSTPKKYYAGNGDQFLRTLEQPPLDEDGFADFEPESLGPDLCIIFRRMLNYKFRNKNGHILKTLEDLNMLCVRALPDIPVAIEFAEEVNKNARLRPRTFALCGEDMLPKYYAVEYTPPKIALLNCICCMSCFRQPFNLAIYGLDGNLALRIVSAPLENCWVLRYAKECCCHTRVVKRMLIKTPDDAVIGSLVEFGHCFMTQWLQIHPGVPKGRGDLADAAVVQWQSKCRCMDSSMLYCGCKTDPDAEGAMIMADKEGRKYATTRQWSGITTEDMSFLFTVRFTENCPIEMKALALAGSFIYNNLNWETKSDLTCCTIISCLFCSLRLWYDGGPATYDYDNWSNLSAAPPSSYIPWMSLNRPAVVNYRRL